MAEPFLVLVQYSVAAESERLFAAWYSMHVMRVVETAGYQWARHYVAIKGEMKHLVLYMVEGVKAGDAWQQTAGGTVQDVFPLAEKGQALGGVADSSLVSSNVYRQLWGSSLGKPLLAQDHPLLLVLTDGPKEQVEEWNRWYNLVHLPAVSQDPWRLAVGRFHAVEGAVPSTYTPASSYLTVWELLGEEVAHNLYNPQTMPPALRAEYESPERNRWAALVPKTITFYRPLSTHWAS